MVSRVSLCGNRFTVGVSKPRKFSGIITRSKFYTQPKSIEAYRFGIRFITQSLTPLGTSFRTGKHSGYQFNYSLREFPCFFISHPFSRFAKVRIIFMYHDSIYWSIANKEINNICNPRWTIRRTAILKFDRITNFRRRTRDVENFSFVLKKFQSEKIWSTFQYFYTIFQFKIEFQWRNFKKFII